MTEALGEQIIPQTRDVRNAISQLAPIFGEPGGNPFAARALCGGDPSGIVGQEIGNCSCRTECSRYRGQNRYRYRQDQATGHRGSEGEGEPDALAIALAKANLANLANPRRNERSTRPLAYSAGGCYGRASKSDKPAHALRMESGIWPSCGLSNGNGTSRRLSIVKPSAGMRAGWGRTVRRSRRYYEHMPGY